MKTSDAYILILFIENNMNIDVFEHKSFKTWPLLRSLLFMMTAGVIYLSQKKISSTIDRLFNHKGYKINKKWN